MHLFSKVSFFFVMALMISGCSQTQKDKRVLSSPSVYKAWDARYHYDYEKRQMIPIYQDRQVGKAWGRDEKGRINYSGYYDGDGKLQEDLLALHKEKLDFERGRRWDELNLERMKRISDRLMGNLEETEEESEDADAQDDGMDFLPTPFIPAGLEINVEAGSEDGGSPFLPLPMDSSGDDEPSPFLPLTP